MFRRHDIEYRVCTRTASDLFANFVPELNCEKIRLLDNAHLIAQLFDLRVSSGSGKIGHPPGAHDDLINAAAGALWCATRPGPKDIETGWVLSRLKHHDPFLSPELDGYDYDPPQTRRLWK